MTTDQLKQNDSFTIAPEQGNKSPAFSSLVCLPVSWPPLSVQASVHASGGSTQLTRVSYWPSQPVLTPLHSATLLWSAHWDRFSNPHTHSLCVLGKQSHCFFYFSTPPNPILIFLSLFQVTQRVFFQKIHLWAPNMSLAALAWRSTVVCLPMEAGKLTFYAFTCTVIARLGHSIRLLPLSQYAGKPIACWAT